MSKTVIKIENLSKIYRLGEVGTGTISHDINRWWKMNILGQEDPFAKVGHLNDRTAKAEKGELVAALHDINLEVKEGEILGIIGKNGAGKSTLLKILSRVTSPTTGSIKVCGRMASLLEVGTGFHPEMTGRENIYMNGTIMGMRKWEIDKQFDAIVDFAGVAKYIDTPVKRYSSGMTVRLGFAIAAHLEPEILIVDEVLAVGDAEFQSKAIGKMQDVSKNDGRTVLFVSHNMAAVKSLCTTGIVLHNGKKSFNGSIEDVINYYLKESRNEQQAIHIIKSSHFKINKVIVNQGREMLGVEIYENIYLSIEFVSSIELNKIELNKIEFFLIIKNSLGEEIASLFQRDSSTPFFNIKNSINFFETSFSNVFAPGKYFLSIGAFDEKKEFLEWIDNVASFEVANYFIGTKKFDDRLGKVFINSNWCLHEK